MYPDYRELPERRELAPLMRKVESLGVSCELGLIQRHCAADPVGLFRFGYTPVDGLVRALHADLEDVGSPEKLRLVTADNLEYSVVHEEYGFDIHTHYFSYQFTKSAMLDKISAHFTFLARKLREDLENGEKLFVYRSESAAKASPDALRLSEAMRRFGRPVLLWMELTDDPAKYGTAKWTVPGSVITGYLDWFAQTRYAAEMSFDYWVRAVDAAVGLWESMPERIDDQLRTVRRAAADGDYDLAFRVLGGLFDRFPDRIEPLVEAAGLLNDLQRKDEAVALLQLGLTRLPDNSALLGELARIAGDKPVTGSPSSGPTRPG